MNSFRRSMLLSVWLGCISGICVGTSCFAAGAATTEYLSEKALESRLRKLTRDHSNFAKLTTLTNSIEKRDLHLLTLGKGKPEDLTKRPAMLVAAGVEGNDHLGTLSAVRWAEQLLTGAKTNDDWGALLESTTIYIVPCLNPDAAESYFRKPRIELTRTGRPTDEDHDGMKDEDGPEDLDKDGQVTWMRIEDPEGDYILDPTDSRLLIKADRLKGEKGRWKLMSEGVDNDKDERWNEDGPGGVNLNRNFPAAYKFFSGDAGVHPVSERESRALADFIVAHPAIGVVFTFGSADNLVQTPKAEPRGAPNRPRTALQEDDSALFKELAKQWREATGLKKELQAVSSPGSFSDWMYFHRGRLSLAVNPWNPAIQAEVTPAPKPPEKKEPEKKEPEPKTPAPEKDTRNEADRAFLKWCETNYPSAFVPWKPFSHPDFPDKKVEIGGFAPFAKTLPPAEFAASYCDKHAVFLTSLARKLPRIGIRSAKVKDLGQGVWDITVQVENTGYLPMSISQGSVSREVHPTMVRLKVEDSQLVGGNRVNRIDNLEGSGGMREFRWVVLAPGRDTIGVEITSMLGGNISTNISLKGGAR